MNKSCSVVIDIWVSLCYQYIQQAWSHKPQKTITNEDMCSFKKLHFSGQVEFLVVEAFFFFFLEMFGCE